VVKDLAIALSLSNLCFVSAWRLLLIPSSFHYYYHQKTPPPVVEYVAISLDVLLVAALFFIGITVTRRSRNEWVRKFAKVMSIFILSVPLYGLLTQIDHRIVSQLMLSFLNDELIVRRLIFSIPLTVTLFVILIALFRINKAIRVGVTLILILSPFVLVTFSQAALTAMKYRQLGAGTTALPLVRDGAQQRPRVLWLIFDELDFRLAFSERPATVELPELDRLAKGSLFANQAYPPAGETFLAMPALTTGRLVSEARRRGPDELMIKFGGDNAEAAPWSAQPNIFSRARDAGFNTALVGWYHPYCRILGRNLTRCAWEGAESVFRLGKATMTVPFSTAAQSVVPHMYSHARATVRTIPFANLVYAVNVGELTREKHLLDFNSIHRQALEAATDPDLGLVMVHWPIPHPPNIYDRARDRISVLSNRSYLDNLELVDRTVGDIRRSMENNDTWDRTVVLVTSDHWWRSDSLWKKHHTWTREDETASGTVVDRRVPFILKLAGADQKGVTFDSPFNTILTHNLLLAILHGEVSDTKGAGAWLDLRRTIGRSPYDDRNSRDAL
jgi:hypothetical protein